MKHKFLTPGFLSVLYGDTLHSIPDFHQPSIRYINKPDARITFFLREAEFQRKDLTDLLKKIVEAMKIPFPEVSFAKILRPASGADFSMMKTPYGIILDLNYLPLDPGEEGRDRETGLHVIPCLSDMQESEGVKRKAWQVLKRISEAYHAS
jgi:hypothetical protein